MHAWIKKHLGIDCKNQRAQYISEHHFTRARAHSRTRAHAHVQLYIYYARIHARAHTDERAHVYTRARAHACDENESTNLNKISFLLRWSVLHPMVYAYCAIETATGWAILYYTYSGVAFRLSLIDINGRNGGRASQSTYDGSQIAI